MALIWNERRTDSSGFLRGYESLLQQYSPEYPVASIQHEADTSLRTFFGDAGFALAQFDNEQVFDYESLRGRALSSSYFPREGHANHAPLLAELEALFAVEQRDGHVVFEYDTHVYTGVPAS